MTAKTMRIAMLAIGLASWYGSAHATTGTIGFDQAQWIWTDGGLAAEISGVEAGVGFFRAEMNIPESPALESAEVIATCDNLFVLYVNGQAVGESATTDGSWSQPKRWDLGGLVAPGRCVLAVEAVNTVPGPAGLLLHFRATLADGRTIDCSSGARWKCSAKLVQNWQQPHFDDKEWSAAQVIGDYGAGPWGELVVPAKATAGGEAVGKVAEATRDALKDAASQGSMGRVVVQEPSEDFAWPEAIAFIGEDCSLYRPQSGTNTAYDSLSVTVFNPRKARAYPEHDLPAPMKVGRKLFALKPARPGVEPRIVLDARRGAIGSPSATFDGGSILVSMAFDDEPFYHIYRVSSEGGEPQRLTSGPFHDIDPAELPDGRIAFTSTRIGTFEEYHNPPSRALFTMQPDGSDIWPLTNTIIFDNEPEVLADGRILFIRSDNFFDRGKVETFLHAIFPDGSIGQTEFGLDVGPDYGGRLRAFVCGSPAPMPDGRVAFVSGPGITVGRPGAPDANLQHFSLPAGDVAALPDGRLLATTPRNVAIEIGTGDEKRTIHDLFYRTIGILDPQVESPTLTPLFEYRESALHSPISIAARVRPPILKGTANPGEMEKVRPTGFLYCQDARFTQHSTAGWPHVRAIRLIAGKGLTVRSSHSYIVHAGNETVELGTVPLAPDGSFYIEVPADTPLALQAVDAEGRSELNEMSWLYVRPGEKRACIGCHARRQSTPRPGDTATPMAAQIKPLRLLGQGDPHLFRGNNPAVTGMMELQFDRYREVATLNRHAETSDPLATIGQEAQALAAQLLGTDSNLKISASQRLSIFRDPQTAPALAACLEDPLCETRVAATMALAACGGSDSIEPLLKALSDPSPLVAQAAHVALENLTGCAAKFNGFALPGERGEERWRQWCADSMGEASENKLIEQLSSGDRDVVRRAAVALGHTGRTDAARAALRAYVERERENNPYPEWRKTHEGDGALFNSLSPANPRTLQAVTRSLGYMHDTEAVDLLSETLLGACSPTTGNLFLAEAAAEALGRIATPEAEEALIGAFAEFRDYPEFTYWYGDHPALMACHASPVHYFIAEALDAMASTKARRIVTHMIRSVPIDQDRALFPASDDYEALLGRVIRRNGAEADVVETCLSILGDPEAKRTPEIEKAIATIHRCWGGEPDPENRSAQILSMVCRDAQYEPRVRAAFERYRDLENDIPRVFDTGIPVVLKLPLKHWVCFYLARALGNLGSSGSVDTLVASLEAYPPEAASGYPDPLGPGVLFLHNDLTPCWRAAAAWALGRIGEKSAVPALLDTINDLKNAPDTRHTAATALGRIGDKESLEALRRIAEGYPEFSTRRAMLRVCEELEAN